MAAKIQRDGEVYLQLRDGQIKALFRRILQYFKSPSESRKTVRVEGTIDNDSLDHSTLKEDGEIKMMGNVTEGLDSDGEYDSHFDSLNLAENAVRAFDELEQVDIYNALTEFQMLIPDNHEKFELIGCFDNDRLSGKIPNDLFVVVSSHFAIGLQCPFFVMLTETFEKLDILEFSLEEDSWKKLGDLRFDICSRFPKVAFRSNREGILDRQIRLPISASVPSAMMATKLNADVTTYLLHFLSPSLMAYISNSEVSIRMDVKICVEGEGTFYDISLQSETTKAFDSSSVQFRGCKTVWSSCPFGSTNDLAFELEGTWEMGSSGQQISQETTRALFTDPF